MHSYTFDLKAAHDMWKAFIPLNYVHVHNTYIFPSSNSILYTQNDTWCRKGFAQTTLIEPVY